jgi:hypothetical protein
MFNHAWAMKRDAEQRQWAVRLAHLERLRPVLREDAAGMKSKAGSMKYAGHLQSVWETPSAADEASQWNHSVAGLMPISRPTFQSSLHAAIALETIAPLTAIGYRHY